MFYYLHYFAGDGWPVLNVFKSVSFRAAFAAVTAFMICIIFAPHFIAFLRSRKIEEDVAKKDSEFLVEKHASKKHTPTMGGVITLTSILVTMLLWCRLDVVFMPLCFLTILALGLVGFYDDYIKLTATKADGLTRREKLFYQFLIGGGVGLYLHWYGDPNLATKLVIPFTDNYYWPGLGAFFIVWAAIVMTGSSNAVNLTDGLDGLATLCITTVAVAFGLIAYFAGHAGIAEHLGMPRVRGARSPPIRGSWFHVRPTNP